MRMRGHGSRWVWRVVLLVLGTTPRTVDSDLIPTGSLQKRKFRYNEHAVPLADIAPSECP